MWVIVENDPTNYFLSFFFKKKHLFLFEISIFAFGLFRHENKKREVCNLLNQTKRIINRNTKKNNIMNRNTVNEKWRARAKERKFTKLTNILLDKLYSVSNS